MPHVPFLRLDGALATFDPEAAGTEKYPDLLERHGPRWFPSAKAGYRFDAYRTPKGLWIVHRYRIPRPPDLDISGEPLPSIGDAYAGRPYMETTLEFMVDYCRGTGRELPDSLVRDIDSQADNKPTDAPAELPARVTLDQAAAAVHRQKRTLERYITKGTLPAPAVEGGGGKSALYDWKVMRPWLTETFGVTLPERYFASRK